MGVDNVPAWTNIVSPNMELLLLNSRRSASCAGDRLFISLLRLCGDSDDVASVPGGVVKFELLTPQP